MSVDDSAAAPQLKPGGLFYRCDDRAFCGLRFPVAPGDVFRGRCPRCGASVAMVGHASGSEAGEAVLGGEGAVGKRSTIHLLLDNWRSLFNVGAAFRTADGAGVAHLYLCGITATPDQHRKLAKTALGAEQTVSWSYHADAVELAQSLKQTGSRLWVMERTPNSRTLFDITSTPGEGTVVVTAGNEVLGVDPGLVALADELIALPMLGSKESLNVAVALSVVTYWLRAQPVGAPNPESLRIGEKK